MSILITSGGTKIKIDRVRHIGNMSSGTFGSRIAEEALRGEQEVVFFRAENSKSPFSFNVNLENEASLTRFYNALAFWKTKRHLYSEKTYNTFEDYMVGLRKLIEQHQPTVIVLAAAVSDYGVANFVDGKIRSKDSDLSIQLKALPKVISKVKGWAPNAYLVGFKLLVDSSDDDLISDAKKSIAENDCDMIVANDLRDIKNDAHRLIVLKKKDLIPHIYTSLREDPNYLARAIITELAKGNA
jgi:phosphopantothenoylcysteine synthetase/decarboxylase